MKILLTQVFFFSDYRAFNVLRQYEESQVREAQALMGSYLLPGGMLIEGTSDPFGRVWAANLLRKPALNNNDSPCEAKP